MYDYIKGVLIYIKSEYIVIENNGIGYEIFLRTKDIQILCNKIGELITVFTYLIHKEDSMSLFGFIERDVKNLFIVLLKVDGIGPKMALKILSNTNPNELYEYIENENINMLKKIPGVGPKMVGKIILELKGKINPLTTNKLNGIEKELISALSNLGYDESHIIEILKHNKVETSNFELEFKKILKILAGRK